MNLIKTKLRNRMKPSTIDALMNISLNGKPIQDLTDFDLEKFIVKWVNNRKRYFANRIVKKGKTKNK